MPAQGSSPITATFPSFMSVYGGGNALHHELDDSEGVRVFTGPLGHQSKQPISTNQPLSLGHHHRESLTSLSDSADSSPTTTSSTFDSVSMTDPSPSSSPESPTSLLPLGALKSANEKTPPSLGRQAIAESQKPLSSLTSPYSYMSDSPSAKGRNVKNLSLNMSPPAARPSTSAGVPTSFTLSAPTSPLKNVRSARRKPANLTIQTPGIEKLTFSQAASDLVPPTPSHRPSLRHFESSPSLFAPRTAPPPGPQQNPTSALSSIHSRPGSQSSFSFHNGSGSALDNLQEEEAPPKSQEAPERGYIEGPARIYDSGVYLYLEPTKDEASKFDVVINVAKEVANPFTAIPSSTRDTVMSVWRNALSESDQQRTPEPETAASDSSFKSAFEWPTTHSPTTPKPESSGPEYIHVPWDHNSEILEDLYPLCEIIDDRVRQGKSVLIHCQLGVSRSASLVIAYGLYKNFASDFHGMYSSVKERSKYIGPNMSLIYQLGDFRRLIQGGNGNHKTAPPEWFKTPGSNGKFDSTTTPKATFLDRSVSQPAIPPPPYPLMVSSSTQTEPASSASETRSRPLPPVPLFSEAVQTTPSIESPANSLSAVSRPLESTRASTPPSMNIKRQAARPLPLREKQYSPAQNVQAFRNAPRALVPSDASLQSTIRPLQMDLMMQDVPASPSVFSPRATQFFSTSFHPRTSTAAGDLQASTARMSMDLDMPGAFPPSRPVSIVGPDSAISSWNVNSMTSAHEQPQINPRSPHQTADREIVRSISDVF
ncbi:MAG: hypothetical protein Q9227_009406 [Pyrenula ochraceoflavens]